MLENRLWVFIQNASENECKGWCFDLKNPLWLEKPMIYAFDLLCDLKWLCGKPKRIIQ